MKAWFLAGVFRADWLSRAIFLLLMMTLMRASASDEEAGWSPQYKAPSGSWQEQAIELPAYPKQGRLLPVSARAGDFSFRVYIDPVSLSVGQDGVIRYSVVIVSSSGIWNVSYEGMRCGRRTYRRYAYGLDGQWQALEDLPWQQIRNTGMEHYRYALYNQYLCDPLSPANDPDEIIRNLRYSTRDIQNDW